MISVGDLVEDKEYEGSIGYVVGIVNHRGIDLRIVKNCHVKFFNDPDEETVIIEEYRLTKVE